MKISRITTTEKNTTINTTIDGIRYEFVSYQGGPFEVYDFPRTWKGVSRFVGNLPSEQSTQLRAISTRFEHDAVRVDRARYIQPDEFSRRGS